MDSEKEKKKDLKKSVLRKRTIFFVYCLFFVLIWFFFPSPPISLLRDQWETERNRESWNEKLIKHGGGGKNVRYKNEIK